MRAVTVIVGAMLAIAGVVWIFQGAGALKGSFMTGSSTWLWIGMCAAVIGSVLVARGLAAGGGRGPGASGAPRRSR